MTNEDIQIILNKARNLCSKNEKCTDDIYKKNRKWGLNNNDITLIINTLKEENFINHRRYAYAFANDKLRFNHWGKRKIEYVLKAKFIEDEFIQEAIGSIDENFYEEIMDEEISKKLKSLGNKDALTKKQKTIQYLTQKGFEYGKVFEFLENKLTE